MREAAQKVYPLMVDTAKLRELRNSSADPNSLVPVGNDKVGFVSDEVRHFMLKKRIEEQYKLQTKSNLAKESGGFGAGYTSRDGKNVVGAAHGLEEMIKQAEIANRKFTDEGQSGGYDLPKLSDFSDYTAPTMPSTETTNNNTQDLLFGANPQQGTTAVGDLLDFSRQPSQPQQPVADLLGGMSTSMGDTGNLLGAASTSDTISITMTPSATPAGGLLDFGATSTGVTSSVASVDPFAPASGLINMETPSVGTAGDARIGGVANSLLSLDITGGAENAEENASKPTETVQAPIMATALENPVESSVMGSSVMSSNSDRYSAFDALEVPGASAQAAENRLLGQSATSFTAPSSSASYGDNSVPSLGVSGSTAAASSSMNVPASADVTSDMSLTALRPDVGTSMGFGVDPVGHSTVGSGLKVAQSVAPLELSSSWGAGDGDDEGGGFVMGGAAGAGLIPVGPAPAAPPPPPPPSS